MEIFFGHIITFLFIILYSILSFQEIEEQQNTKAVEFGQIMVLSCYYKYNSTNDQAEITIVFKYLVSKPRENLEVLLYDSYFDLISKDTIENIEV